MRGEIELFSFVRVCKDVRCVVRGSVCVALVAGGARKKVAAYTRENGARIMQLSRYKFFVFFRS